MGKNTKTVEHEEYSWSESESSRLYPSSTNEQVSIHAHDASSQEHEMSLREALRYHKRAIFWAATISLTIVMEGYDSCLIPGFLGYPEFQKRYGVSLGDGRYELTSFWQSALGSGSAIGLVCGVMANGYLTDRWGHKHVIMSALVVMSFTICLTFFAVNVEMLFIGQVLSGLPWGVFATMGPTYSAEVCPMALRGYLTSYVNMCWTIGQFIAAGVLRGLVNNKTEMGFRIPFAIQWVWPIPLMVLTYLAPDSPWWLVRKGREDDALIALKRLSSPEIHLNARKTLRMIIRTDQIEREQSSSIVPKDRWKGYSNCFKGTNSRRTEIACITFAGQVICGSPFAYAPSYFFRQVGLDATDAYKLNLGITGIAFGGCICSWFLLTKFGRRSIYLAGLSILNISLFMIGILQFKVDYNKNFVWVQCFFLFLWVAAYACTLGPVTYTIVSEVPATRVKSKTFSLARTSYHILQIGAAIIEPYLINPMKANLKGYTGFVWLGTAFPALIWAYFRLPETKNRTYEELNLMFERDVPARRFSNYKFDMVP